MNRIAKKLRSSVLVLAVTFAVIGIAGCEQAPDQAFEGSTEVETASEQYVTVAEAKEQAQELAGGSLDGIYFPDYVVLPEENSISTLKLTPWHVTEEDSDKILTALQGIWSGYDSVDWLPIEPSRFTQATDPNYWAISKEDDATGLWYSYDSVGFFCGSALQDMGELSCDACVKSYDFEWGDAIVEEDNWQLMDGECSVAEAVEAVEGILNEYLSPLENDAFTYRVQHLYVMENPDTGCYEYNMSIGRVHEGMAVDTSSSYEFLESGQYYDVMHGGAHFYAVMRHKEVLDYFNIGAELLDIESEEEEESIVSPIWAAQQIKEEIAHANKMSFSDFGLVYVLEQDNTEAENRAQGYFEFVDDDTTYLRPVWAFLSAPLSSSLDEGFTQDSHGECVLVDAVTGELYHYDCTGVY